MSEFERLEQLLAEVEIASAQAAHRIRVERCRKEFASIRADAHAVAHEICNARESYRTIVVECAEEGKRLGAWAALLRTKNADMEARKLRLALSDPAVKALWDQATAILRHEAESYMIASEKREAHKTYGEKMLDKASIDMRMGRADIVERVQDLRSWLHSEEEMGRRAAIKSAKIEEIMDRQMADQAEAHEAQELLNLYLFGMQIVEYINLIGAKLDILMPHLVAESEAQAKKAAFVARMKAGRAAKQDRAATEEAARLAQQQAEEAELQRLIAEEDAAKAAAENKARAAFFLAQAEQADNLDDVKTYVMAAKELDASIDSMALVNMAASRLASNDIEQARTARKAVDVCHVKHTRIPAKERRELARNGVRGKDWSRVAEEAM